MIFISRFFAKINSNASRSKVSFKKVLPLVGLLGSLHCSEFDQTPSNPYSFLREISLPATNNFVPFRPSGFNSDILVAENELLVYFVPEATSDQRRAVTDYLTSHNIRKTGQNLLSNMVQFQIPSMSIFNEISNVVNSMPGVVIAAPNFAVSGSLNPNPNPILNDVSDGHWWINEIRAREAWDITTGPASIAIVDTGIDINSRHFDRPILRFTRCTRSDGSADFSLYAYSNPFSCAQYFPDLHGTAVASLAAASGRDNFGGVGMVWSGQITSVDVYGYRPPSNQCDLPLVPFNSVDAGIQIALTTNNHIINVSMGSENMRDPQTCRSIVGSEQAARHLFRSSLANSIRSAFEHNALVVFSAGNDGFKNDDSWLPASQSSFNRYFQSNVLIVGASDETHNAVCNHDYAFNPLCGSLIGPVLFNARCVCSSCEYPDTLLPYTAEGRVVELFAPGYRIALSRLNGSVSVMRDSNGTSLSAPLVSGTAALMWSINPNLRAEQVKQILLDTARSATSLGGCRALGRGILDAAAAVRRARDLVSLSIDSGITSDASADVQTDSTSVSSDVVTGTPVLVGRTYGPGSFNQVRRFGSSLIVSGISSSTTSGITNHQARFARYDVATGTLLWSRTVDLAGNHLIDNSTNFFDVIATSDGYISAYSIGQPSNRLYLVKIGFDGQVRWVRDLSSSAIGQTTQVSRLFPQPDGSILLVSRSNLFGDAGSGENSVLTSFDSTGNIRFSRSLIQPAYSHLGRYPILDSILFSNRVTAFYSRDAVSLDTLGNFPNRTSFDYFGSLRMISSGGYIRGFTPDEPLLDGGVIGGNVIFDSRGQVVSRTPISLSGLNSVSFFDTQATSDGFLISGSASDSSFPGSSRALLVRTNLSGQILWQMLYGNAGSYFYSAAQFDSGFVAVGIIPDSALGSSWIVRIDASGNPQ